MYDLPSISIVIVATTLLVFLSHKNQQFDLEVDKLKVIFTSKKAILYEGITIIFIFLAFFSLD